MKRFSMPEDMSIPIKRDVPFFLCNSHYSMLTREKKKDEKSKTEPVALETPSNEESSYQFHLISDEIIRSGSSSIESSQPSAESQITFPEELLMESSQSSNDSQVLSEILEFSSIVKKKKK